MGSNGRLPAPPRISGDHQSALVRLRFPQFRKLRNWVWEGLLQPSPLSRNYKIRITHREYGRPLVELVDPPLATLLPNGGRAPHTFPDGSLCLHVPQDFDARTHTIAESIIPWASTWLYFFEVWLITGDWLGGGHEVKTKKDINANE